jgi:hypothetical protein
VFGELGTIVKWGVGGAIAFFAYKLLKKPANGSN